TSDYTYFTARRSSDLYATRDFVGSPRLPAPVEFISFFFCYYVHHLDLHSFPTRRSSDLGGPFCLFQTDTIAGCVFAATVYYDPRSEEHTSELQSRFDLVCRLLLEKKNIGEHPVQPAESFTITLRVTSH